MPKAEGPESLPLRPTSRKGWVPNVASRWVEGAALRRLREQEKPKVIQDEMANRLGLKRGNSISKIERGQRALSLPEIQAYLAALGRTFDEFLRVRAMVVIENQELLRREDPDHAEGIIAEARVRVRPWLGDEGAAAGEASPSEGETRPPERR